MKTFLKPIKNSTHNGIKYIVKGATLILVLILYISFFRPFAQEYLLDSATVLGTQLSREYLVTLNPTHSDSTTSVEFTTNSSELFEPSFTQTDPRVVAMRNFLVSYQSPMAGDAEVFIKEADRYGLDWRLVASISGVESAFGNLIPPGSYNGWGWKGDPARDWSHFGSWENGITTVTRGLALGYGTHLTPFEIEPTYCPPCGLNPRHEWANGVTRFMYLLNEEVEKL